MSNENSRQMRTAKPADSAGQGEGSLAATFRRLAVEHCPTRLCFASESGVRETTAGAICAAALPLASALVRHGIRKGDVIAIQLPNRFETALLYAATTMAGAVLLPIVDILGPADVAFILRDSRAKWYVVPARWRDKDYQVHCAALGELPDLDRVIVLDPGAPGAAPWRLSWPVMAYADLSVAGASEEPLPAIESDEVFLLLYTSGTTARPKGALHTHDSVRAQLDAPFLHREGRFLCVLPAGHIAAFDMLMWALVRNVDMVLMDRFDPRRAARLIADYRVEQTCLTPYFLHTINAAAAEHGIALDSLRNIVLGAAGIAPALILQCERPGCQATRAYGSTEIPRISQGHRSDPLDKRAHSDGRVQRDTEIRIVDDNGVDLPSGENGEIWVRGPQLFVGYTDPATTEAAFATGGWFKTGDIGCLDYEGYLTITDRKKDIIIRGGEKISSVDVESLLARHPHVVEAAAIAVADELYGERVCACVKLRPGETLTLADIQYHFQAAGVARQKTPERLVIVEDFPRTPAGKIKKPELRSRVAAGI